MTKARMLGTVGQPFCGKCCGEHAAPGHRKLKRQSRQIEKREVNKLITDERKFDDADSA